MQDDQDKHFHNSSRSRLPQPSTLNKIHPSIPPKILIPTTTGTAEYAVPDLSTSCKTWYQIHGSLTSPTPPLIILHGGVRDKYGSGPGATHEYLLPLIDLAPSILLIFYDQIGNGLSTHLRDKAGDEKFWSFDLFIRELDNLIVHLNLQDRPFDILGHSWGGMLAAEWSIKSIHCSQLRRLILSNTLASIETYERGVAALKNKLPEDVQRVLDRADEIAFPRTDPSSTKSSAEQKVIASSSALKFSDSITTKSPTTLFLKPAKCNPKGVQIPLKFLFPIRGTLSRVSLSEYTYTEAPTNLRDWFESGVEKSLAGGYDCLFDGNGDCY
ncbi:hypothetical protein BOTCAL_0453g00060 [Botryotinia calthae]|uniref:AB hydrolase-1 domain-containing protein n=1 Tax=Botryotinia calthae TaxID=38488 RepID=A0A4Y8CPQ4_9HELO|nr:hypothetical protein BOTCAL_0453g00060 [Botryotinia calthae]